MTLCILVIGGGSDMDNDNAVFIYNLSGNTSLILHVMKRLNQDMGLYAW